MKSIVVNAVGDYLADVPYPSQLQFTATQHKCGQLFSLFSASGLCYQGFHSSAEQAIAEYAVQVPCSVTLAEPSTAPIVTNPSPCFHLIGTEFQVLVWQRLCSLANNQVLSYSQFADLCQRPSATRAIASAIAKNPIAVQIPCHRIVPKSGGYGQYRWGATIKQQLLSLESSQI